MIGINSSLTALNAYAALLNNTANNIANMNTEEYDPLATTMQELSRGGVTAYTAQSTADRVDISQEAVNMILAETGFKANVAALKTEQETERSIIDLMA